MVNLNQYHAVAVRLHTFTSLQDGPALALDPSQEAGHRARVGQCLRHLIGR